MTPEKELRMIRLFKRLENPDFLANRAAALAPYVCCDEFCNPQWIAKGRIAANKKFSRLHWAKLQRQRSA